MEKLREQLDSQNLHSIISELPSQLIKAWSFTEAKFSFKPEKIYICGMGGSALPANIFKTYLQQSVNNFALPIHIIRDYDLPQDFDQNSGGIFISYSGNTEEVLSAFNQALQSNTENLIAMSTGGQLEKLAQENNVTFIKIPSDVAQPRFGYGYFVGSLIKIFHNSELIQVDFDDLQATVNSLLDINDEIDKQGQELAKTLQNKIPIIYTSDKWKYLAMIIKINFNENAKVQSFWNAFPELNHNEMVGFTDLLAKYKFIIFQDKSDHEKAKLRMDVFKKLMEPESEVEMIEMKSGNAIYKIFSTLMIGLWASYYLALLNGIDPAPVKMVEKFKQLIKE